jgi:hypothetical protein
MIGIVSRGIVAGALVASAGVFAFAGPAAAAESGCGTHKVARGSLYSWACNLGTSDSEITYRVHFQNNHGSQVLIDYQNGVSVAGGAVHWDFTNTRVPLNTGNGSYENYGGGCTKGQKARAAVRIKENNGSWGTTAYSASITCK